jgi:hypothetical protein
MHRWNHLLQLVAHVQHSQPDHAELRTGKFPLLERPVVHDVGVVVVAEAEAVKMERCCFAVEHESVEEMQAQCIFAIRPDS